MNRYLMRVLCITCCFLLGCVLFPSKSQAISNANWWRGLQLNYNAPGARAMGMGGAFISIADDATAAVTNPAGLTVLTKPEFSIEFKFINQQIDIKNYETEGDSKTFDNHVFSPAFLSYVVPKENFTFAIFRHEALNFENNHEGRDTALPNFSGTVLRPEKTESEMSVVNYGIGVGIKISNSLSIGGSIAFSQYNIDAREDRTNAGVYDFKTANIVNQIVETGSDTAYSGTIGVIYKPYDSLQIGAVYFKGPKFTTDTKLYVANEEDSGFNLNRVVDTTFKLPDYYGIGISYKFLDDALTLSYDVKRIEYSDITDKVSIAIGSTSILNEDDYDIDDGWVQHIGMEYVMPLGANSLALRAGYFYEPDHVVRYIGDKTATSTQDAEALRYPIGDSAHHATFGVGFTAEILTLDFATNLSSLTQEFTVSCIYRF